MHGHVPSNYAKATSFYEYLVYPEELQRMDSTQVWKEQKFVIIEWDCRGSVVYHLFPIMHNTSHQKQPTKVLNKQDVK